MYGQWAIKCTVVAVWSNIYQLSLSKGLTECDCSAMHQHTTLLANCAVAALRPIRREGKGRKEGSQD